MDADFERVKRLGTGQGGVVVCKFNENDLTPSASSQVAASMPAPCPRPGSKSHRQSLLHVMTHPPPPPPWSNFSVPTHTDWAVDGSEADMH